MGDIELRVQEELTEPIAGEPVLSISRSTPETLGWYGLELEVAEYCDGMEVEDPVVDSPD